MLQQQTGQKNIFKIWSTLLKYWRIPEHKNITGIFAESTVSLRVVLDTWCPCWTRSETTQVQDRVWSLLQNQRSRREGPFPARAQQLLSWTDRFPPAVSSDRHITSLGARVCLCTSPGLSRREHSTQRQCSPALTLLLEAGQGHLFWL